MKPKQKKNLLLNNKPTNGTEVLSKAPEKAKKNETKEETTHLKIFNSILDHHKAAAAAEKTLNEKKDKA